MQYTIRNVPREVDAALRERARRANKSMNQVLLESLAAALGLADEPSVRRDLGDIAGQWADDPAAEQAFSEQRTIDEDLWR